MPVLWETYLDLCTQLVHYHDIHASRLQRHSWIYWDGPQSSFNVQEPRNSTFGTSWIRVLHYTTVRLCVEAPTSCMLSDILFDRSGLFIRPQCEYSSMIFPSMGKSYHLPKQQCDLYRYASSRSPLNVWSACLTLGSLNAVWNGKCRMRNICLYMYGTLPFILSAYMLSVSGKCSLLVMMAKCTLCSRSRHFTIDFLLVTSSHSYLVLWHPIMAKSLGIECDHN